MSRYVHGSGRDDAQLNNRPQSRFPKIPGLSTVGLSPPTVQLVSRVATMAGQAAGAPYYLTGGLCENAYVVERLGALLGSPVTTSPLARFAGAIGAGVRAQALGWCIGRGSAFMRILGGIVCV